ncbi:MAG: prepilin peptidase [Gemmatimonadetes bacterium]|nr:prepilin peptidase [Gemmatimonadota bacterium]
MAHNALLAGIAAVFGAVIGSFLNVCIVRWPAEQSVVSPRSRCPSCGYQLAWFDIIPILSWLVLRGRCRGCQAAIGRLYPLVELATAAIFAFMAWRHGLSLEAAQGAFFLTVLLGIAMTDARKYLIPDEFTLGGLVVGLGLAAAGGAGALVAALIGGAVGFGLLWLVGWLGTLAFKEEAMGGGDIKMMAMVGAFVGWQGVLLTIFLGALSGTLIFLPMALRGKKKLVPFGVFLAIGAMLSYLVGPALIEWYRGFVGAA